MFDLPASFNMILLVSACPYLLVLLLITIGWFRMERFDADRGIPLSTSVSIIIPVRNESLTIGTCLEGLLAQDYPGHLMEIIIVDDHSDDQTIEVVNQACRNASGKKITTLSLEGHYGKKEAIRLAVKAATGEFILCTDADCAHPVEWVRTMAGFYEKKRPVFVSGPVKLRSAGGLSGRFQEVEFMSLAASGAGAIGAGLPIMCNGANLGFSSEAYRKLKEDALKTGISSGDDVFLMLAFRDLFGSGKISFVKSYRAMVRANASPGIKGFINQRLRWVSKSRAYRDPFLVFSALSVMIMNLALVASAIAGMFDNVWLWQALFLLTIKTAADFPLLTAYSRFAGMNHSGWIIPVIEPVVALTTTFTALAGNVVRTTWKGRKIR